MTEAIRRRRLVKHAVALGGTLLLRPWRARAQEAVTKPVNQTLATIHDLHSTHGNFDEREVPEEQIDEILSASVRAANSSNIQTYSIVATRDRAKMRDVCGYAGSCLLVYCVDYNRLEASATSLGHPYHPDTMTAFVTGSINAALAAQTAVIAARSLGIDSLLTNGIHRGDMARLWTLLDLPERHCFPLIALVLGYATGPPKYRRGRLAGVGVLHRERYHRPSQAETVQLTARYDDPDAHLGLIDDWAKQGHKHYLDWLFTSWLGRRSSKPTTVETQILQVLKKIGFVEPHTS